MPSKYHRILKGPDLDAAFEVQAGIVGIESVAGLWLSLALPQGSLWPGLGALPDDLLSALQSTGSVQTPGTVVVPVVLTARELRFAVAALQSARLSRGPIAARLKALAEHAPLDLLNQSVTACLIGVTRESVSKALSRYRRTS